MSKKTIVNLPKYDVAYVDAMNACSIAYYFYTINKKFAYKGVSTGMLYGVIQLVHTLYGRLGCDAITFLWEGTQSIRKAIFDAYKGNRIKKNDNGFKRELAEVRKAISWANVSQASHAGLEADDLAGFLSKREAKLERRVLLVSNDRDWWQFVHYNWVDVFVKNEVLTYADLYDRLGYPPEKIPLWKILKGDASDNVKGIPRFPTKVAVELVKVCSSYEDFVPTLVKSLRQSKWAGRVRAGWDVIERNARLVTYHPEWVHESNIVWKEGEWENKRLAELLKKRGCNRLLQRMKL